MDYQFVGCWSWRVLSSFFEKPFICYMRGPLMSILGQENGSEKVPLCLFTHSDYLCSQPAEFLKLLLWLGTHAVFMPVVFVIGFLPLCLRYWCSLFSCDLDI